jgi:outer membrane protein assembly factor BamB
VADENSGKSEMTAEAFLALLEERDLVPPQILASLRSQMAKAKAPVPARQLAKALVNHGDLTAALAQRLLATAPKQASKAAPADRAGQPKAGSATNLPTAKPQPAQEKTTPALKPQPGQEKPTPALKAQPGQEKPTPALKAQPGQEKPSPALKAQPAQEKPSPALKAQPGQEKPSPAAKEKAGHGEELRFADDEPLALADGALPSAGEKAVTSKPSASKRPAPADDEALGLADDGGLPLAKEPPAPARRQPAPDDDEGFAVAGEEPEPTITASPSAGRRPASADDEGFAVADEEPPPAVTPKPSTGKRPAPADDEAFGVADDASPWAEEEEKLPRAGKTSRPAPKPAAPRGKPAEPSAEEEDLLPGPGYKKRWKPRLPDSAVFALAGDRLRSAGRRGQRIWQAVMRLPWAEIGVVIEVVLAVAIVWAFTRRNPDEMLKPADAAYKSGAYSDAIARYDEYLAKYSRRPKAALARVRRGLAQLQVTLSNVTDGAAVTATTAKVLQSIRGEAEFEAEAKPVLPVLLPRAAEELTEFVRKDPNPATVAPAQDMLALANEYLPAGERPLERLGRVDATLTLFRYKAAGPDAVKEAAAAIHAAVTAKDYAKAYGIRAAFLKAHVELAASEELGWATASIGDAEQAAVAWVARQQRAEKSPPPSAPTLVVAHRVFHADAPGGAGNVVFAAAAGAVYGLDAASGQVLWQQYAGLAGDRRDQGQLPQPLAATPGSDVVLGAALRQEVRRLNSLTGRTLWRQAIGEPLAAEPVAAGERVLVATPSGRLVVIDAATGDSAGFVQFPQPLGVAPAVDPRRNLVFQLAEHDDLFVLGMPYGKCLQVVHLGHDAGSIAAAPVVLGDFLLVAVNDAASRASLRVLAIESSPDGTTASLRVVQTIPLAGHVDLPPSIAESRVAVTTDAGAVRVFERVPGNLAPLQEVASADAGGEPGVIRFPLLESAACYVGDTQLTRLEIRGAEKQLVPTAGDGSQQTFCQPLVAIGSTLFQVRRMKDMPGVVVSAFAAGKPDDKPPSGPQAAAARLAQAPYWQTYLGAPPAVEPLADPDGGKLTVVTTLGGVFQWDAAAELRAVDQAPAFQPASLRQAVRGAVRFRGGTLVLSCGAGSDRLLVFDPKAEPEKRLTARVLPGALCCSPVAMGDRLFVPLDAGQALLMDPLSSGGSSATFQPPLRAAALPQWGEPVAVGEDGKEVVLSDGRTKLYRVHTVDKPVEHLWAAATAETAEAIVSPLALVGKTVCGVDAAGKADFFQLPDLSRSAQLTLGGHCLWGPRRVGRRAILVTDDDQLTCLDESGRPAWQVHLPYGPLAGIPLAVGDQQVLLASAGGIVWRADAASGKELKKVDLGQPLATGPVALGKRLFVGGPDGSVLEVVGIGD